MIVSDTSSLLSLATGDLLEVFLNEFHGHTTETVTRELEETQEYDDIHATSAEEVLDNIDAITVHTVEVDDTIPSRLDEGEASCAKLTHETDADYLITDDLRALPELEKVSKTEVAISPIVIKALVKRDALTPDGAEVRLERIAENRDWLESPIYRRAKDILRE